MLNSKLNIIKLDTKLFKLKKILSEKVGLVVQSLLFSNKKYSEEEAKKWAKSKGYKVDKAMMPKKGDFIHLRQKPCDKFNAYRTVTIGEGIKARIAGYNVSKFAGHIMMNGFSKFSEDIKSENDLKIPMKVELKILCDGPNRDGEIKESDLAASLSGWARIPIIDFHNMNDMKNPTEHKISDRKGFLLDNTRLKVEDGKRWIINDAYITDRYLAYLIYLSNQQGKPYEISPEYGWTPYWIGGKKHQTNINPKLITITDEGHIKGNKLTIKAS